jgi:hypothetical protein
VGCRNIYSPPDHTIRPIEFARRKVCSEQRNDHRVRDWRIRAFDCCVLPLAFCAQVDAPAVGIITCMLDDLYWVMSYSRWKDDRYWSALRDALTREHPSLTREGLLKAREFDCQRYHF